MNTNLVRRSERKFVIGKAQAERLFLRLRDALPGDPYAGYAPYHVRSLYFDSFRNGDYSDKLAGIRDRKKIRMRIYDENPDPIKFELKEKTGDMQQKHSFTVSRALAEELTRGEYRGLLREEVPELEQIYYMMVKEVYRPKCVVEYERRAFAVPTNDIRITFDTKIMTSEGNLDLFAPRSFFRPADVEDLVVLEVKYNHFLLSYVKSLLASTQLDERSYSKYIAARQLLD